MKCPNCGREAKAIYGTCEYCLREIDGKKRQKIKVKFLDIDGMRTVLICLILSILSIVSALVASAAAPNAWQGTQFQGYSGGLAQLEKVWNSDAKIALATSIIGMLGILDVIGGIRCVVRSFSTMKYHKIGGAFVLLFSLMCIALSIVAFIIAFNAYTILPSDLQPIKLN